MGRATFEQSVFEQGAYQCGALLGGTYSATMTLYALVSGWELRLLSGILKAGAAGGERPRACGDGDRGILEQPDWSQMRVFTSLFWPSVV